MINIYCLNHPTPPHPHRLNPNLQIQYISPGRPPLIHHTASLLFEPKCLLIGQIFWHKEWTTEEPPNWPKVLPPDWSSQEASDWYNLKLTFRFHKDELKRGLSGARANIIWAEKIIESCACFHKTRLRWEICRSKFMLSLFEKDGWRWYIMLNFSYFIA